MRLDDILTLPDRPSQRGEVPWEIVPMLPRQGDWSVEEYLALNLEGPRLA